MKIDAGSPYNRVGRVASLLFICLILLQSSFANRLSDDIIISGTVTAAGSGEGILRAEVTVIDSATGAVLFDRIFTDENGTFTTDVSVGVGERDLTTGEIPTEYWISDVHPNPVRGNDPTPVKVQYTIPGNTILIPEVEVYDILGRRIGRFTGLSSGVYFLRLRFDNANYSPVKRFLLVSGGSIEFAVEQLMVSHTSPVTGQPIFKSALQQTSVIVKVERAGFITSETNIAAAYGINNQVDVQLTTALPPSPSFTYTGSLIAGEPIVFDASASEGNYDEEVLQFSWDFGNGKTGGGEKIGYMYANGGTFDVTLTATGLYGASAKITQQIEITPPSPPAGAATIYGRIQGSDGFGLAGVEVLYSGGDSIAGTSNVQGEVTLEGFDTGVPVVLHLRREGYADQFVRLEINEESEQAYFETVMVQRGETRTIDDIEFGGDYTGADGTRVILPVDAFINGDGETVTGPVTMTLTPLDVSDDELIYAFPGSFSAVTPEGFADVLLTYGVAEYIFEQNGEPVRLAPGKSATIEIPIYIDMGFDGEDMQPGDVYPLWSMDETTGLWIEEGTGIIVESSDSPTGLAMRAEVTHFSWWNCDIAPFPYRPIVQCKIVDNNGLPTLDIPSGDSCYLNGAIMPPCGGRQNASTNIPSGLTIEVPLTPNCDVMLIGFAQNGLLRGSQTVNGPSTMSGTFKAIPGEQDIITIALSPVDPMALDTLRVNESITDTVLTTIENISYFLEADVDEYIVVSLARPSNSALNANLRIYDPAGNLIAEASGPSGFDPLNAAVIVSQPGLYHIEIEPVSGTPSEYILSAFAMSEYTMNSAIDGFLEINESHYFYFSIDEDIVFRDGLIGSHSSIIVAVYTWTFDFIQTTSNSASSQTLLGAYLEGPGTYIIRIGRVQFSNNGAYSYGATDMADPANVVFDDGGQFIIEDELTYNAEAHIYSFEADPGTGFHASLMSTGQGQIPQARIWIGRVGSGTFFEFEERLDRFSNTLVNPDNFPPDVLIAFAARLDASVQDTYVVAVFSNNNNTGPYKLQIDVAGPSSEITVSADLGCEGATVRSVGAALYAIQPGGTVTVCEGVYEDGQYPEINTPDITLRGTNRDNTILTYRGVHSVLSIGADNFRIENITIEAGRSQASHYAMRVSGNGFAADNIMVRPMEGLAEVARGIDIIGSNSIVENSQFERSWRAVSIRGDNTHIENNTFIDNDSGVHAMGSKAVTVRNNQITQTRNRPSARGVYFEQVGQIQGGNHIIENNTISLTGGATADGITLRDNETLSIIRNNDITVAQGGTGMFVQIGQEQAAIVVEKNRINNVSLQGGTGIRIHVLFTNGSGEVLVQNNIVRNYYNAGIWIQNGHYFVSPVMIYNNSFASAATGFTQAAKALDITALSTASGHLPVFYVNNVVQGREGRSDIAIQMPADLTIDSDYNLFHQFETIYSGGTTSTGNNEIIDQDPEFINDDLEVASTSPAVDSGAAKAEYPDLPDDDFSGNDRPQGQGYDIGAHERVN